MKKRSTILVTVMCIVVLLLAYGVVYAVDSSQQAEAYAHKIFPQLMQDCANNIDDYSSYFKNEDEAKAACLGEPITVYVLNSVDPDISLIEQAKQVSWYAFPIEVNGESVTDLRVTLVNGNWIWDFGGSLNPMLNQVASANNINAQYCMAVMLGQPGPTYIVANKDGKEVAVRNYKNPESLKLTQEGIQAIKMQFDTKATLEQNMVLEDSIVGGTLVPDSSFKQNASVYQRLIIYLDYITQQ